MLFGGVVKAILGDRDTYAGCKSIHHRTKKRSPEIQNPAFRCLFKYKIAYSINIILCLRDDFPRLNLHTETDASI